MMSYRHLNLKMHMVERIPGGIACASGTCSSPFYFDLPVILVASPAAGSIFAGWMGACTNGSGDCQSTMDFNKSATGIFNHAPVRLYGTVPGNYASLQGAYDAAAPDDLIQAQAAVLNESPLLDRPIAVTIKGGV